jgi:hypothetical protein
MKKALILAIAATVAAAATPARAAVAPGEVLDVTFSGTVAQTAGNTGYALGASVTGEFVYSTTTSSVDFFTVAGQSIPTGFDSTATTLLPPSYSAFYTAQISPVAQGGTINNTFNLDLEALNTPWPSPSNGQNLTADAIALLTNTSQLRTNLDTVNTDPGAVIGNNSTFGYYTANADGTNIVSLTADLTSINVSVPEPASVMLLATAFLGLGAIRRRA